MNLFYGSGEQANHSQCPSVPHTFAAEASCGSLYRDHFHIYEALLYADYGSQCSEHPSDIFLIEQTNHRHRPHPEFDRQDNTTGLSGPAGYNSPLKAVHTYNPYAIRFGGHDIWHSSLSVYGSLLPSGLLQGLYCHLTLVFQHWPRQHDWNPVHDSPGNPH